MPQRPDRVARQWRIPAWAPVVGTVVVCVVLLLVVAFVVGSDDEDGESAASPSSTPPSSTAPDGPDGPTSTTSTTVAPDPVPLTALTVEPYAHTPPASYRVVYEVVENALPRNETWTVRRPYESLVVADRDGVMVTGTATSRAKLSTYLSDRDAWFGVQPQLHRAAYDQHPLAAMATMVELGLAAEGGSGEFAGRSCRVFVTGPPLSSGSVGPADEQERTEACLDDAGLVLHERWEIDGDVVVERTATAVEIDPAIDPAVFDPEPVVEESGELNALLATIAVPADEETLAGLRTDVTLPESFTLDGTVFRASTSDTGVQGATEVVRFFSRGFDLVEVAEVTNAGPASLGGGGALPVDAEGFREVWFDPDHRASALRVRVDDSTFVELRGGSPALLVDVMRSLTPR